MIRLKESDKMLTDDEKLQDMTIQDLLDYYYDERNYMHFMYEFIISACDKCAIDKEILVKDVIDQLIDYSRTYDYNIEYKIFDHMLRIEIELYMSELRLMWEA